jgi:type IV pilus assembly protein PilE
LKQAQAFKEYPAMSQRHLYPAPRPLAPAVSPNQGFTLVELMVVLVIASILAAFAYPSYRAQIEKTRRADAEGVLMQAAQFMERIYTENGNYNPTGACDSPYKKSPIDGSETYYTIALECPDADRQRFRIVASPTGPEAGAGLLDIDDQGRRGRDRNFDNDTTDEGEDRW